MSDEIIGQILAGLNRIEGKVDRHHQEATQRLDKHVAEEERELRAVREQHLLILNRITEMLERTSAVETAFLRTHDDKPDYHGHREDHGSRKRIGDWLADAGNKVVLKLLEYGTLAFVIWALSHLWKGFLKGPE